MRAPQAQVTRLRAAASFSDQIDELSDAMQLKGVITNLDQERAMWTPGSSSAGSSRGSSLSQRPQSVGFGDAAIEPHNGATVAEGANGESTGAFPYNP